jgi:hypothetical protein
MSGGSFQRNDSACDCRVEILSAFKGIAVQPMLSSATSDHRGQCGVKVIEYLQVESGSPIMSNIPPVRSPPNSSMLLNNTRVKRQGQIKLFSWQY